MPLTSRPYEGPGDLLRMQELVAAIWKHDRDRIPCHIGDLAWWRHQHVGRDHTRRIRLWENGDGSLAAWAWLALPKDLVFQVHPRHEGVGHDAVLAWLEEEAVGEELVSAYTVETDQPTVVALERRSFERRAEEWAAHMLRDLREPIPNAPVPEGFVIRHIRGDEDVEQRVEVHRSAFAPSNVVPESYRNVMACPSYRASLDWVAEAPDGRIASFCLAWLDEENRVGEFEPVGTHEDFRRRGLARAVCSAALRALREQGAERAIVYSVDAPQQGPAFRLYEALGFATATRAVEYRKSLAR